MLTPQMEPEIAPSLEAPPLAAPSATQERPPQSSYLRLAASSNPTIAVRINTPSDSRTLSVDETVNCEIRLTGAGSIATGPISVTLWCPDDDGGQGPPDRFVFLDDEGNPSQGNQLHPALERDGTPFRFRIRGRHAGASKMNVRLGATYDNRRPNLSSTSLTVRTAVNVVSSGTVAWSLAVLRQTKTASQTSAAQFDPFSSSLGGQAYGAVYVTCGRFSKVSSSSARLRFHELPDTQNNVTHPENENHVDVPLDFAQASGWQKLFDPDGNGPKKKGWWPSPEAPTSAATNAAEARYRALIGWNTTIPWRLQRPRAAQGVQDTLLGHNGAHLFSVWGVNDVEGASLNGTSSQSGAFQVAVPQAQQVNVKNLVITSVSPSNQVVILYNQTAPVAFNVQLADWLNGANTTLTLTIRRTFAPGTVIRTVTTRATGLSNTLEWNLKDDRGNSFGMSGGYFTFDVQAARAGEATQTYRSSSLKLTEDDASLETDANEEFVRDADGKLHALFRYKLSEAPKAASGSVRFYEDTVDKGGQDGLSDQNRWSDSDGGPASAWVELSEAPSIRAVMSALDVHAVEYRDHKAKPMLDYNKGFTPFLKYVALTFVLNNASNGDSTLSLWYKVKSYKNSIYRNWTVEQDWTANSGSGTTMNSDTDSDGWTERGPIPASSSSHNTVYQNSSHWLVDLGSPNAEVVTTPNGFTWKDEDGTPRKFFRRVNGKVQTYYRNWRFSILDGDGQDYHNPVADDGYGATARELKEKGRYRFYRHWLRVHEDGGDLGTDGCVGLTATQMESVWNRFTKIGDAMKAFGHGERIPLQVYDSSHANSAPDVESASWGIAKSP